MEPARLDRDLLELQEDARLLLTRAVFDYMAGGADDEVTLRDNLEAWARWRLRPDVLRDVSRIDCSATVLGRQLAVPVLVAPLAYQRMVHPEGEAALARGAAQAGSLAVLSTRSSVPIEEVARAAGDGGFWFQVYVLNDRGWTAELVDRAVAAGAEALVVTVDTPRLGHRRRDVRNRFELPEGVGMANLPAAGLPSDRHDAYRAAYQSAALQPADLTWLAERSGLPVVAKGVLSARAARRCVDAGARGVIVSNHGGRQLDGAVAGADALPEVVGAVAGSAEVLVDGGIRRGTDVLKALALGARAVLIGRPAVWGLTVAGDSGVARVIGHLRFELELAMGLAGVARCSEAGPDLVLRPGSPWPGGHPGDH